jgi:aminoglycoside/choline kinase family phosphotransferase
MDNKDQLIKLFEKWSGEKVITFSPLPLSGSARKYFRIISEHKNVIGAYNSDERENRAFLYLSNHFRNYKLPVPKIYTAASKIYLQEDLGNSTLFSLLEQNNNRNKFDKEIISLYKKVLTVLPRFQVQASKKLDYSFCYRRDKFDKQSMMWDLNYFKYYFLKLANISFDEQRLEEDFNALIAFLLQADSNYFMYRDFNSRNIMVLNNEIYFIDYQGGRKGALQYDIASLLFDSKADIPFELREKFLSYYLTEAQKISKIDKKEFLKYYYGYVLIRLLQMFGAYGFRGFFEGKSHFLRSIPFAQNNLQWLLENHKPKIQLPELYNVLDQIAESKTLKKYEWRKTIKNELTVNINSFSYRKKIPADLSGNGGGFVFDCRALNNPGRFDEYKLMSGKDRPVKDFLDAQPGTKKFLDTVYKLIDESIKKYRSRGFTDLMVNFGCTGGRHRSVYCAEQLAAHIKSKFKIKIILDHSNL